MSTNDGWREHTSADLSELCSLVKKLASASPCETNEIKSSSPREITKNYELIIYIELFPSRSDKSFMFVSALGRFLLIITTSFYLVGCSMESFLSLITKPQVHRVEPPFFKPGEEFTLKIYGENLDLVDSVSVGHSQCHHLTKQSNTSLQCRVTLSSTTSSVRLNLKSNSEMSVFAKFRKGIVLGPPSLHEISAGLTRGAHTPQGVSEIDNKLYFIMSGNCIVNILNSPPTSNFPKFDSFLGQESMGDVQCPFIRPERFKTFAGIYDLHSDGTSLVAADKSNNRVLIWHSIPKNPMQPADVVVGQPDYTTNTANSSGVSANTLSGPRSARIHNGKLIVSDTDNHRILIWNKIPTRDFTAPDLIWGQTDGTSNTANAGGSVSALSLASPDFADVLNGNLVVSDTGNHRVLIFDGVPSGADTQPVTVLGQSSLNSNSTNGTNAASRKTLKSPMGVAFKNGQFFIADYGNNRVLVWNSFPSINAQNADIVVGQVNFAATGSNTTDRNFSSPRRVSAIGNLLYVSDTSNHRFLTFNLTTLSDGISATNVIGQPSFTESLVRNPGDDYLTTNPTSAFTDGRRLAVADYNKNRVLLWNTLPTADNTPPDIVLGQTNFSSVAGQNSSFGVRNPFDVLIVEDQLLVSDGGNNRVLIWNSWPVMNGAPPDVVIGQTSTAGKSRNQGGIPGPNTLGGPRGLAYDGTRLFIADFNNHRVLIYDQIPTTNNESASIVIGQPDFQSVSPGSGAAEFRSPQRVRVRNNKIFVADRENERLMIFNQVPTMNGVPADSVIGQYAPNTVAPVAQSIFDPVVSRPVDIDFLKGNMLMLSSHNVLLSFDGVPSLNGAIGKIFLGPEDYLRKRSIGADGLQSAFGIQIYKDEKLLISDYSNNRILILNVD